MIQKVSYSNYSPQSRPVSRPKNITFGNWFSKGELEVADRMSEVLFKLAKGVAEKSTEDARNIPKKGRFNFLSRLFKKKEDQIIIQGDKHYTLFVIQALEETSEALQGNAFANPETIGKLLKRIANELRSKLGNF